MRMEHTGKGGVRLLLAVQKHGVTTAGVSLFLVMKLGLFEIRVDQHCFGEFRDQMDDGGAKPVQCRLPHIL